jgi:acyl transferase domain-containing protein/NADPH:quinone reductase-like Zn-dependent oxidoreductase
MSAVPAVDGSISAIKLALQAKQMRAQAGHVLRGDPIAIVGMGCRIPGAATPDQMWQLLRAGVDCVTAAPRSRWDADSWYDPNPAALGKSVTREGGFLDQIDGFDAEYFGILPREADRMDPQQRLVLEVAIEAIDDAGLPRPQLRRSRTAVYVAACHNDYARLQLNDPDGIDARTVTGTQNSIIANRLSYLLDLRGPSISIDSACSSSLVAVHLGCQSLRTGETDLAIAGGVSVMIGPEMMVALSKVGFMAPDGRCKTFDARADGFGRGEGCGIVVLKRLSDAIADDDRILAVIRGSAVNQDGRSTLLAAPNGIAQDALIREALATAQIEPARIGYFEAHGTGTALGDPIEVEAIATTIGGATSPPSPCWLGSAKANFGHLEAAAGVIGLIKTVLVLRHGAVPPQPHFSALNPHISLAGTRLAVPAGLTPWPEGARPRCAAVSSFGVGGTNANVVLEEAPRLPPRVREPTEANVSRILPLSAQTPAALQALVNAWVGFLPETPAAIADICHTAALRRTHADCRVAVTGSSKEEMCAHLETLRLNAAPGTWSAAGRAPRAGFVFCGQGAQWHAMGRELMAGETVFRDAVDACDRLLRPMAGWSLIEELERPEEHTRLADTEFAQPALFSLQAGLAALWRSWGLTPAGVIGHSVGEIAALHIAGVLNLPEAIRVVWQRGRVMAQSRGSGRMAAIGLGAEEAAELIAPYQGRLDIAAVNGPHSVVVSGETTALDEVRATLAARCVRHRLLTGEYAFHSTQMEPLAGELVRRLGVVRGAPAAVPVYSTVSGGRADGMSFDAHYFGRNVREPVRFMAAMQAMLENCDLVVEIGPQPVLAASIIDSAPPDRPPMVLASLRRGQPERATMLRACAEAYAAGWDPSWDRLQTPGETVELPPYPWQRKRHWHSVSARRAPGAPAGHAHPLLGRSVPIAGVDACVFEGGSQAAPPWVADHRIRGRMLLPAAAVIEAFDAAARLSSHASVQLTGFAMHRAFPVPEPAERPIRWQVCVKPSDAGGAALEWHVAGAEADSDSGSLQSTESLQSIESWRCVASARAEQRVPASLPPVADPPALDPVPSVLIYAEFGAVGAAFGPAFQRLRSVERAAGFARATISETAPAGAADSTVLHAAVIDAAFQLCLVAAAGGAGRALPDSLYLPLGADRVVISPGPLAGATVRAWSRPGPGGATLASDIRIAGLDGSTLLEVDGLHFARAGQDQAVARPADGCRYDIAWTAAPELPGGGNVADNATGSWLIFADRSGIAGALSERIRAAGGQVCLVLAGESFHQRSADEFVLDPADPDQFRALLRLTASSGANGWRGVVHCWPLDVPGHEADGENAAGALPGAALLHLAQALTASPEVSTGSLVVVTRGAMSVTGAEANDIRTVRSAGVWALGTAIASEHPELRPRMIDLDPQMIGEDAAVFHAEVFGGAEQRVAVRDGKRWVPRLRRPGLNARASGNPTAVTLFRAGTFDGVDIARKDRAPLRPDEVRVEILAAGLNFRDVLMTLALYPGHSAPLGAECVGRIVETGAAVHGLSAGDRVMGYVPASLATEAVTPASALLPMPEGMTAEAAAALPVAFMTASYGLEKIAGLRKGQRILIHAAAGGVGLAALQLARRTGAEIFATAGSAEKRALVLALGAAHVFSSRSIDFADHVLGLTSGRGVDVVLNSLTGPFIPASLRTLADGGCFLELGKREILSPEAVAAQRPGVRYVAYDLSQEIAADPALAGGLMRPILDGIAAGELRPLPVTVFPLERARDAMRFMAQGRHIGKLVLRNTSAAGEPAPPPVSPAGTYWITGGLGALGRETARWLVRRGARHLVLSSRGGRAADPELMHELQQAAVDCRVIAADAGDRDRMAEAFAEIRRTMPPLRGVIHAAGVLHDAALINQRWTDGAEIRRGKVDGAWILHELTRDLPLDFFVLYSAAAVVLGGTGQAWYAAANAELDGLAQYRRRIGLPALSVAWGPWAGAGMAAELSRRTPDTWAARGLGTIDPATGFAELERLLADRSAYGAVIPIDDWERFLGRLPRGVDRAFFADVSMRASPAVATARPGTDLPGRLKAMPAGQRREALMTALVGHARHVIGLDAGTPLDLAIPLREMGLDSLMAVELRNVLVQAGGKPLPATLLFDYPEIDRLAAFLHHAWGLDSDEVDGNVPHQKAMQDLERLAARDVADLSDAEAELLLNQELEPCIRRAR